MFFREINEDFFNFIFVSYERQEVVDNVFVKTWYFNHADVGNIVTEYLCPALGKLFKAKMSELPLRRRRNRWRMGVGGSADNLAVHMFCLEENVIGYDLNFVQRIHEIDIQ